MKKRNTYAVLFGIPGLFVAGIISIVVFSGLTGILWIYVFGDNPWPPYVGQVLSALFIFVVLAVWFVFIALGYFTGRRLESDPVLNRSHVLISAGVTMMFVLLMVFQQWKGGNIGSKSDSALCSNFCIQHGYSGSGMPPDISGARTCSCYDVSGNEALRIPVDHLELDSLK